MTDITGRALYPLSEVIDTSTIPYADALPAPQLLAALSSVYCASSSCYLDGDRLVIEMELAIEGEIAFDLPGDVVSVVIASGGEGWTDLSAAAGVGADPFLSLLGLTAGLRVSETILADVESGAPAEIEVGADVTLSAGAGIAVGNPVGITLRPAFIAGTPLVIEAADIRPVFNPDELPAYVEGVSDPAGLAIEALTITVPEEYLSGGDGAGGLRFGASSVWVDREGLTAQVAVESADLDAPLSGSVLGQPFTFRHFRLSMVRNTLTEASVGFDLPLDLPAVGSGGSGAEDADEPATALSVDAAFGTGGTMSLALAATQPPGVGDGSAHLVSFRLSDGVVLALDGLSGSVSAEDWSVHLDLAAEVAVGGGDGDSFIASILGEGATVPEIALGLVISDSGVSLADGTDLDLTIPLDLAVGPLTFTALHLGLADVEDDLVAAAGVDLTTALGILTFTVADVGAEVTITPGRSGAPTQASVAFRPPHGIGLAVGDSNGPISGGGYLYIDAAAGRYEGVVDLQVAAVGICAFVLIDTQELDGWSMFFALFIELPAIQLGFGFTLNGVGGVAGINRGIDTEALGSAVRAGTLDSVLFPDDPIADAPVIFDTIRSIFPAAEGQFVFGPVVKIGWGTPTLVSMAVGIVIELPDPVRIAILGSIEALLPRPEAALVELHLDVAGVIDFQAGTISIDASLHHSKIVGFDLAGDMALRAGFKGQPTFLLALGGFHPDFEQPAGFPALARLSLGMDTGPAFRITFESYLAITSNTVQFGAAFEIVGEVGGFGVSGGAGFDALIQFNPFRLKTSIGLYIAVTAMNVDLMGVWLDGHLEGPNRWHVWGSASFKVLGLEKSVNVDEFIGSGSTEIAPAAPDVLAMVVASLQSEDALVAAGVPDSSVTVGSGEAAPASGGTLRVAPSSELDLAQNVAPLAQTIAKFGNAEQLDHSVLTIEVGGGFTATGSVEGWFSPAQFTQLPPAQRISAPSFELMPSGVRLGGAATAGPPRATDLGFEPILVDPDLEQVWVEKGLGEIDPSRSAIARADGVVSAALVGAATATVTDVGTFGVSAAAFVATDALTGSPLTAGTTTYLEAVGTQLDGAVVSRVGDVHLGAVS